MTIIPDRSYLSLFPRLTTKLRARQFDTIEIIEAELQLVLNTLTKHNFKDSFKKWQTSWERCIRVEGDYSDGDVGQQAQS
jgi:hypothetical protein